MRNCPSRGDLRCATGRGKRIASDWAGFASVVIVPLKTEREEPADLLVVTRDLWSLRLSSDFETAGSVINYALLSLTDTNLLGYNKTIQASFYSTA